MIIYDIFLKKNDRKAFQASILKGAQKVDFNNTITVSYYEKTHIKAASTKHVRNLGKLDLTSQ